jgi:hypothetical protein
MKYARLSPDGVVIEVFTTPTGFILSECFHSTLVDQFQECPSHVEQNWVLNPDSTYEAPPKLDPS